MASEVVCCFHCSRVLIYIFNLIFWMFGTALLGLGIWLYLSNDVFISLAPGYSLLTPAALFMIPGCLSIAIGFIGCCGAITENRCMVTSYCVLVMIVFTLELAVGVATLVSNSQLKHHIEEQLRVSIDERYPPDSEVDSQAEHYRQGWAKIQTEYKCCGINSYHDWFKSHGWPKQDRVPDSCCISEYVNCGLPDSDGLNLRSWYTEGCMPHITDFIDDHLFTVAVTILIFAGFQLLSVVGAIVFLVYHRRKKSMR